MKKLTLTWKVDKTIPTGCPDYQPDPYTGEYPSTHCLVYHCKTVTESKNAEFETMKECEDFVSKAPPSCYDFKVNGEHLKDTREKPQFSNITYSGNLTTDGSTTVNLSTPPQQ